MPGESAKQIFQVANWPRLPDKLDAPEQPEVAHFAAQAKEWMRELCHILDHTLLAGGATAAESSDALKNYPYPPGAVIYADADGKLAGDAGFTYDAATDIATLSGGAKLGNLTPTHVLYAGAGGVLTGDANLTWDATGHIFQVTGQVTAGAGADGATLLKLNAQRAWAFMQGGDGASARLRLKSLVGAKQFDVECHDGTLVARFNADASAPQIYAALGSAAAPSYSFIGRTGDGFYSSAAGAIRVALGGVAVLQVTNSGGKTLVTRP